MQQREWAWMDCSLALKRACKRSKIQVYEILASEYAIQFEDDNSETELSIQISMEKKINEDSEGFTWHKSWNIPSLEVKILKKDLATIKSQLNISRVYCEMTAGYPTRKMSEYFLEEVPLEGETRKEISLNGVARFSNLKFSETSFNHAVSRIITQRNKFSLILVIFTKRQQNSRSIIKSFISMPIYVDSRKEARKKITVTNFLSDIIPVEEFLQDLESRHRFRKLSKCKQQIKQQEEVEEYARRSRYAIQLSLNGFVKYYSSANIRNKIKHPFYFVYHYSNIFTLFYNRQLADTPFELLLLMEKPLKHNQKYLMLAIQPSEYDQFNQYTMEDMKKKILTLLENWKYFFIQIVIKHSHYYEILRLEKVESQKESAGDIKADKWAEMSKDDLLAGYQEYYKTVQSRENFKEQKLSEASDNQPQGEDNDNDKRYEHYEIHQSICIQPRAKTSKAKIKQQSFL